MHTVRTPLRRLRPAKWPAFVLLSVACAWAALGAAVPSPPASGAAPSAVGVEGHWEGTIELPGTKLAFDVDLRRKEGGSWSGDISIPAQAASKWTRKRA